MTENKSIGSLILGLCILSGLFSLGYLLANAAVKVKEYERSVTVKGLSEREYPADIVIWPIQFTVADNDLGSLYDALESNTRTINEFLKKAGVADDEISASPPSIIDKSAQSYNNTERIEFRYSAQQTVTVYSDNVDRVRSIMNDLLELGKKGIAFTGQEYQSRTEFMFTQLNQIKPEMIEEATTKAREVAQKFAEDSNSKLGKIKRATQGQFTIGPRDTNNPHIKKIRVVSTVEYYLSD